jgi:hypothetical protein
MDPLPTFLLHSLPTGARWPDAFVKKSPKGLQKSPKMKPNPFQIEHISNLTHHIFVETSNPNVTQIAYGLKLPKCLKFG